MEYLTAGLSHLLVTVFLHSFAASIVIPIITDVTMEAICPGRDECSLAIYLSGIQQAIIGSGALFMTPVMGNLSDKYGRKTMLALPLTVAVIPIAILAYRRDRNFYYTSFLIKTVTGVIFEGSVHCFSLAYVADHVPEGRRGVAFGILSGLGSVAMVCGTLSARFLPAATAFQVSASVGVVTVIYMLVFLKESVVADSNLSSPFLSEENENVEVETKTVASLEDQMSQESEAFKHIPSLGDMLSILQSSGPFSKVAFVAYFISVADSGLQVTLLYYLKARFGFDKDQFAYLLLIAGISGAFSQLVLMPFLAPVFAEEKLLSVALFFAIMHAIFYSIAWASWVPYAASILSCLFSMSHPCIRSIVSKHLGASQQGKGLGFILGISSFASILSPLTFSPLTALFLSEHPPFQFPGFSMACVGFVATVAFIGSLFIWTPVH